MVYKMLLKRFTFLKTMWLNSIDGSEEQQEWESQMNKVLEEMNKLKSGVKDDPANIALKAYFNFKHKEQENE